VARNNGGGLGFSIGSRNAVVEWSVMSFIIVFSKIELINEEPFRLEQSVWMRIKGNILGTHLLKMSLAWDMTHKNSISQPWQRL
jgi:hypothetical protein